MKNIKESNWVSAKQYPDLHSIFYMEIILFWFQFVSSSPINSEPVLVYTVVSLFSLFYS